MDSLDISTNAETIVARFVDMAERQVPYAISRAINDTALDVLTDTPTYMQSIFDRPTPYALNSFMIYRGTKEDPTARIEQKPQVQGKTYLETEATGGQRKRTALESYLASRLAYGGILAAVLPADNARINQYGNWDRGQINQVLSGLKAAYDPLNNATPASQKRKGRKKTSYFIPKSGLPPGIYRRDSSGHLGIIAAFIESSPQYQPRFDFQGNAAKVVAQKLPDHFATRFREALATAR